MPESSPSPWASGREGDFNRRNPELGSQLSCHQRVATNRASECQLNRGGSESVSAKRQRYVSLLRLAKLESDPSNVSFPDGDFGTEILRTGVIAW
jgi:hypothetical protein